MKTIKIPLKVKYSKDKKTGSWVIYSKKFEVSSYGKTKKKAKKQSYKNRWRAVRKLTQ